MNLGQDRHRLCSKVRITRDYVSPVREFAPGAFGNLSTSTMVRANGNATTTLPGEQPKSRRFSTVISDAARKRRDAHKGPQPWLVLKLTIAIAAAIFAYTVYVYIGRLCIAMIKRESSSLGSRTMGSEQLPSGPVLVLMTVNSRVLGCVRCAWNDDDLGIHQSALATQLLARHCS